MGSNTCVCSQLAAKNRAFRFIRRESNIAMSGRVWYGGGRCDERVSRASMGHQTRADDGNMNQQVVDNISTGYTWFFLNVDLTLARESNKPLLLWQSSCASVSCRVSGGATVRL